MESTSTEQMLLERYGNSPLLSIRQLADILHRSPEGLRITMSNNSDLANKLRACKLKLGRRVYFRVAAVAQLIDQQ